MTAITDEPSATHSAATAAEDGAGAVAADGTAAGCADEALARRLQTLPREVGVLLVTIGVMGIALPGLVGTPALLAGGLMLWPRGFRSVDTWLARRWPWLHRQGSEQLIRYLDDMERRYPTGR
ncbi:MAG: hypothetical protein ACKO35_06515 [Planctomycetaceae bacterium]